MIKKPTRIFTYPKDGGHMCKDGKIRAAVWGVEILNDEEGGGTAEEIKAKADKGQRALDRGADTNKSNLIANIVWALFKRGQLEDYVNREGEFLDGNNRLTSLSEHEEIANKFRKK